MTVDNNLIARLKLAKGDTPLGTADFAARTNEVYLSAWPSYRRNQALIDPAVEAERQQWLADIAPSLAEANLNNTFNWQLAAYREAATRLARYRLADGQAEVTKEVETGTDENGDPIMETVVVQTAIDPLPATVEQDTYDAEGNVTGSEQVPNPQIVKDDAERAAAQAVIDDTPDEVKTFD